MRLSDLENGDVFAHENDKRLKPKRFVVYGNPFFNRGHGNSTRNCLDNSTTVSKSCRLKVVKLGTSIYVDKIKAKFNVPAK